MPGSGTKYDDIVNRCACLFAERDYHKQILEHLRLCRNETVHGGGNSDSEKFKHYCYQLQYYYKILVKYHLNWVNDFNSLTEVNEFLDMPSDIAILEKKLQLQKKALRFRRK